MSRMSVQSPELYVFTSQDEIKKDMHERNWEEIVKEM